MLIAGLVKTSLIDFPEKIATVVFLQGCNFNCSFCHNPELIDFLPKESQIKERDVLKFLKKRKNKLEGVVITGGEPTLYKDLPKFIKKIKKMGYLVKLDTNGTNPAMIQHLNKEKLVDYWAMDIKGPLDKYPIITKTNIKKSDIKKSIELIKNNDSLYEFRTTVVPQFFKKTDIPKIGKLIKGARVYWLQQFRPLGNLDSCLIGQTPYSLSKLQAFAKSFQKYVEKCKIRGV